MTAFPIPERAQHEIAALEIAGDGLEATVEKGDEMTNADLDEHEQAALARDEGMKQAEVHADSMWKTLALNAIWQTAMVRPDFISDDVWTLTGLDEPKEARALGPLFREAARRGWIVKTDRTRPSVRSHLSGKPVWKSLVFGGSSR